ncbi:MAG: CoA pyrophosphatase [Bacteroidota bacterium]|nr:CoA pyrophosphatase [Bacteroidota bacterium]
MFVKFIEQLKVRFQKPLPGEEAQFLMAPFTRQRIQYIDPLSYNPRKSAVLILLFPVEESIHTLLIQRPVYEGVHSGQVAFPGGKFEETDIDLSQTALRETFEEVGAPSDDIEIIGKLTDLYINPSNFLVSPFIGFVSKQPDFIMDAYEVQKIISVDLFNLNDKGIKSEKIITHSNNYKIKTPYYEIEGLTVWGATAMMISELNVIVEEAKIISF